MRQPVGGADRLGLGEAGMHVDQKQRVRRQPLAQSGEDVVRQIQLRLGDEALRRAERIELHRLEAPGDDGLRGFEEGLRRALGAIPAIGIAKYAVAHPPAEQLVHRHAERFAENVPAGDLDRRDRRAVDVAAVERDAVEHLSRQRRDAARIRPDDEMFQLADRRLGRADEAVQRAFAEAGDAGIGVDADEQPVLPAGADGKGLDSGDLHALPLVAAATRSSIISPYRFCSVGTEPHSI